MSLNGVRGLVALLGVAAAAGTSRQARADAPMSNETKAEQLFRAGEKNYDSGHHAEACANFQESLRIAPKLGTLLNLALCHETIGKVATAWSEFHHGAAWSAQNNQRDRHEFAMQHILALEPRLPRVTLHLPAATAFESIEIDGGPLPEPRWYLPLYLDPGDHTVAVRAPGKRRSDASFRVVAAGSEQMVAVPSLEDDDGAAPARPRGKPGPSPSNGRKPVGYVLLGTGGVAFAGGLVFGVMALTGSDADVRSNATLSTVTLAIAGAATAGGLWLVLSSAGTRVGLSPRPGGGAFALSAPF